MTRTPCMSPVALVLLAGLSGCELLEDKAESLAPPPDGGTEAASGGTEEALLPELYLVVTDWKEDCEANVLSLTVQVSNYGDMPAEPGAEIEILALPDMTPIGGTVLDALTPGELGEEVQIEVALDDLGPDGVLVIVDGADIIPEYDTMPNELPWDHSCCETEVEEPPRGELWGTASANMGEWDSIWLENVDLAPLGQRPGGLVWRMDLDTEQVQIVRWFDPELDHIWMVGGLALHPTEPIVYVTAFSYDPNNPSEDFDPHYEDEYLDGWDTLIAIDTNTYQVLDQWDMNPDAYSFTGLASDFVDGSTGLYSPGGLNFVDGTLFSVEGMTVKQPNLVELDLSTSPPNPIQHAPAFDIDHWGGGLMTDSAGDLWAVCAEVPEENEDPVTGDEIAYIPEPWLWIPFELYQTHDCSEAVFEFELDRVHGIAFGHEDTLYAVRSTRTYWYEEALGGPQAADLQLYTVDDTGAMTPIFDLAPVMASAPMPIDGLGNIDWRP